MVAFLFSFLFFFSGADKISAVLSSFPQASNQTLLDKFKRQHEGNSYIEFPAVMEPAFIIRHYAGKVKYGVKVGMPGSVASSPGAAAAMETW